MKLADLIVKIEGGTDEEGGLKITVCLTVNCEICINRGMGSVLCHCIKLSILALMKFSTF